MKTPKILAGALLLTLSTSSFALHAKKKENIIPKGDVASHSIVKLLIGNASCTGSFLSKRTILTAAHCVPGWATGENLQVLTYDGTEPQKSHVINWEDAEMEAHPTYDFNAEEVSLDQVNSDLAVITLKNEIAEAKPVLLYSDLGQQKTYEEAMKEAIGSDFYLAGNGSRQRLFSSGILATLDFIKSLTKQTTAELVDFSESSLQFKTKRRTKVCQGDSGGPAFLRAKNGQMVQFGVVSIGITGLLWAKNCGRNVFYSAVGGENLTWVEETQAKLESRL